MKISKFIANSNRRNLSKVLLPSSLCVGGGGSVVVAGVVVAAYKGGILSCRTSKALPNDKEIWDGIVGFNVTYSPTPKLNA